MTEVVTVILLLSSTQLNKCCFSVHSFILLRALGWIADEHESSPIVLIIPGIVGGEARDLIGLAGNLAAALTENNNILFKMAVCSFTLTPKTLKMLICVGQVNIFIILNYWHAYFEIGSETFT